MGKLTSNPKLTAIAVIAIAVLLISLLGGALGAAFGFGFLASPIPAIQLPAERVVEIAGYELMNTYLMFWLAGIVLMLLTFLATRKMRETPGRWQGLFEGLFEFFTTLAESSAGGRKGRMFLPIVTGIFLVVLFSNWLGTLPGVGTIGRIESVEEYFHHKLEETLSDHEDGEAALHLLEEEGLEYFTHAENLEAHPEEAEVFAEAVVETLHEFSDTKFVVFTGDSGFGTIPLGRSEESKVTFDGIVEVPEEGARLDFEETAHIIEELEHGVVREGHAPEDFEDLEGGRAGILVPFLRGASTDLNTTLAIAIVAMISVQFWGFKALGFSGYAGKFIIIPFRNGKTIIDTFVGGLELIGEGIKVISFTFRLFGNMFAGEILLIAMGFLFPLIGIIPFLGLELFVGVIQAAIFSVLTLIFGSIAIIAHGHGDEHAHAEEGHH